MKTMRILAIETSCDETAVAVLEIKDSALASEPRFKILSNVVSSQVKVHAPFGGVVPNLAKREHQRNLIPVLIKALKKSKLLKISNFQFLISKQISNLKIQTKKLRTILEREPELLEKTLKFLEKYAAPKIDLIAVTWEPGLEPALWVGRNFAKALACAWNKPFVKINHLEGHIFSVLLKQNRKENFQFSIFNFQFPAVALLVSGGHTQLLLMKDWLKRKIIGETLDDAAGEAFDKTARLLELGYPGGPAIARLAEQWKSQITNHKQILTSNIQPPTSNLQLPRPMLNSKDFNFSFSGLKTAVLYLVQDLKKNGEDIKKLTPAIAAEFQQAVIDVLIAKTIAVAKEYKAKTIILCGGVAANKELREQLRKAIKKNFPTSNLQLPTSIFCGDNAAMIALAACFQMQKIRQNMKVFDGLNLIILLFFFSLFFLKFFRHF